VNDPEETATATAADLLAFACAQVARLVGYEDARALVRQAADNDTLWRYLPSVVDAGAVAMEEVVHAAHGRSEDEGET
jgi:hypothetical protein